MLPDINEVYPQLEEKPVQQCDNHRCDTDLYAGDEIIEHAGYHYCCGDCLVNQMLKDGHALKIIIGGH